MNNLTIYGQTNELPRGKPRGSSFPINLEFNTE